MKSIEKTDSLKIYIYRMKQDDPRKCTSAKLCRLFLAKPLNRLSKIKRNMVVLNPTVMEPLLPKDRENIRSSGVVAIDCSWKRFNEIFNKSLKGLNRRLPILMTGNPVNYGKKEKLSSAEAIAAALYITGYKQYAERILSKFNWGKTFFDLNIELLEEYSRVTDVNEIEEIERSFFRVTDYQVRES